MKGSDTLSVTSKGQAQVPECPSRCSDDDDDDADDDDYIN